MQFPPQLSIHFNPDESFLIQLAEKQTDHFKKIFLIPESNPLLPLTCKKFYHFLDDPLLYRAYTYARIGHYCLELGESITTPCVANLFIDQATQFESHCPSFTRLFVIMVKKQEGHYLPSYLHNLLKIRRFNYLFSPHDQVESSNICTLVKHEFKTWDYEKKWLFKLLAKVYKIHLNSGIQENDFLNEIKEHAPSDIEIFKIYKYQFNLKLISLEEVKNFIHQSSNPDKLFADLAAYQANKGDQNWISTFDLIQEDSFHKLLCLFSIKKESLSTSHPKDYIQNVTNNPEKLNEIFISIKNNGLFEKDKFKIKFANLLFHCGYKEKAESILLEIKEYIEQVDKISLKKTDLLIDVVETEKGWNKDFRLTSKLYDQKILEAISTQDSDMAACVQTARLAKLRKIAGMNEVRLAHALFIKKINELSKISSLNFVLESIIPAEMI